MKCLCCNGTFEGLGSLEQLMKTTIFFGSFLQGQIYLSKKCFRRDYFCPKGRDEKVHNFLEHYQHGGTLLSEDKPMKITYFDRDLQKYCITFSEDAEFLDFYDPREVISQFVMVFEQNFVPRPNLEKVRFKCSFTIIN